MDCYIEEITEIYLGNIPVKISVYENLAPETLYMLNIIAARYFRRDKIWYKNPITAFEKAYRSASINVMNIILSNENDMKLKFSPTNPGENVSLWEYTISNNNENRVKRGYIHRPTFEKIMRKIGCEKIAVTCNSYYYVKNIK